ncbi:NLR family, pyrin domain containing 5 [Seminavis robusta]|uniref:NLR family, pyrin domain containing 5 n=1 Tax=Seminavis robusta TaxID=568900 RepID=A0A9N8HI59_9STRA|nr:NLR family, pyrin domain containing 5 [Seminavis robusta]|eukprot:Sro574_g169160.1 NLR family, pyrin domain containing 5 (442) ;mRNA; f:21427-22752
MAKEEPTAEAHKEDSSSNKSGTTNKKAAANAEEVPHLKEEDPIRRRLCGTNLNLWLWSKQEEAKLEHAGSRLLELMAKSADQVETVDVGADLWTHLPAEDATKVLEAVAELPKLKWVRFSLLGASSQSTETPERASLPIKVLARIASHATELEHLILEDVVLDGTAADWRDFIDGLQSLAVMAHLRLEKYSFTDNSIDLGDLVTALSSLPNFTTLEVFAPEPPPSFKSQGYHLPVMALECLVRASKSVQVVRLSGLDVRDEHLSKLVGPLSDKNHTLKELLIWRSQITEGGAGSLADALKTNVSLLKLNLNDNDKMGSRGCQTLFEAVSGSNLEELCVGYCHHMDTECRQALLSLVASNNCSLNRKLKRLETCFSWPLETTVQYVAEFGDKLVHSLRDPDQVLLFLRLYCDQRHGDDTKELHWGSFWEKRPIEDDADEKEE